IGDPAVALMMNGRLVGASALQIVIAHKPHIGRFGRGPDLLCIDLLFWLNGLALSLCGAAENEQGCEADCRFDVSVHVFPPRLLKPISR
ncbi:MAG: hypothetical protein WBE54_16845, partial [Bradyrhizobium sp.]